MSALVETIEPKLYAGVVADEILSILAEAISERGSASLILSGGTSPGAIYRALAHPPRVNSVDWSVIRIFFGDERWVASNDDQSNFHMAQETLLCHLGQPGAQVTAVNTGLSSPAQGALDYERRIRSQMNIGPREIPVFDLVLLGMGKDGHTASLFPGSAAINERSRLCLNVEHNDQSRVTLTVPIFARARNVIFIVTGDAKSQAVKHALQSHDSAINFPARIFDSFQGRVSWFLDSAAAQDL